MGRDGLQISSLYRAVNFNPRARVGRDAGSTPIMTGAKISIHAPVWGATCRAGACSAWTKHFNPRARVGRDCPLTPCFSTGTPFQSTRPCGARPKSYHVALKIVLFQSTRPCGVRHQWAHEPCFYAEFQSTRPCGARPPIGDLLHVVYDISIHAPVWGATLCFYVGSLYCHISIHAPVWGATFSSP